MDWKKRCEEKGDALFEILEVCLKATNHENMFHIAQDALDYILVLEQKLEEYHPDGKGCKDDADVAFAGNKYWGHARCR